VIEKYLPLGSIVPFLPSPTKTIAIPDIKFTSRAALFSTLPKPVISAKPLCFEDLDQGYGFVLYRTTLKKATSGLLKISELRDYATVYVNGKRIAVLDRHLKQNSVQLSQVAANATLDILVENNGRINYGPYLTDNRQGITQKVTLGKEELTGWKMYKFPFVSDAGSKYTTLNAPEKRGQHTAAIIDGPALYKGTFELDDIGDTFLDMHKFGKGFVFLNGHNLGKYWYVGPQQTLYVPKSWLKQGQNEIVVFDELKGDHVSINALDKPILNMVVKEQ
jgi:beta-galactosidase